MNPSDLEATKSFLEAFGEFEQSLQELKITTAKSSLGSFLQNFDAFERLSYRFREMSAEPYNVFSLLRLSHKEELLHTPFLADLLNPRGTHCQGRLFFDAFLTKIAKEPQDKLSAISGIEVLTEHHTLHGRLDILIRYQLQRLQKVIVIENKIYAQDGNLQLKRYHQYLTETLRLSSEAYQLLYLCPRVKSPSTHSISEELSKSLKEEEKTFREIGYREDILPMLLELLPLIKAPVVASTLEQYIKTLKTF